MFVMLCVRKANPLVTIDEGTGDAGGVVVNDPNYRQGICIAAVRDFVKL